jgi:hypothetical protein
MVKKSPRSPALHPGKAERQKVISVGVSTNAVVDFVKRLLCFIASAKSACQENAKKFHKNNFRVALEVTRSAARIEEVNRSARIKLLSD